MTKYDVRIDLDKSQRVYFNGEKVSGHIKFKINENQQFKSIFVGIYGKGNVKWFDPKKRYTWRASKEYINESKLVAAELDLDSGKYSYPFEFTLPDVLPPSYEHTNGKIRYHVFAIICVPWGLDKKITKTFSVLSHMDLNKWPALRNHIEVGDDKQLYNGQSKAGESVLTVFRISKNGYVPGESIPFSATINNRSKKTLIKIKCQFVQNVELHEKRHTKKFKHKIFEVNFPNNIESGTIEHWQGRLPIPAVCQSFGSDLSKVIDLNYSIVLYFDAEFSISKETPIPITIGTIPLKSDEGYEGNSTSSYENAVYREAEVLLESDEEGGNTQRVEDDSEEKFEPLFLYYPQQTQN